MIFDRNHGAEPTGEAGPGTTLLIGLHVVAYGCLALLFAPTPLAAVVLAVLLIAISVVDIQRFEIPDVYSALLLVTGLANLWLTSAHWIDRVLAGLAFPALLYLVGITYLRFRRHPGLGLGDVKLAGGLGLWLGLENSMWALLAASVSGIAVLLAFSFIRKAPMQALGTSGVAFGPFLCLSAWAVWLQGNAV